MGRGYKISSLWIQSSLPLNPRTRRIERAALAATPNEMQRFGRGDPAPLLPEPQRSSSSSARSPRLHARTPFAYRLCETATELLIYFLLVFTPWAFGTTQSWSIWTLNVGGYLLGFLLAAKWFICWLTGFKPARWVDASSVGALHLEERPAWRGRLIVRGLALLTVLILAYTFLSAANRRATFNPAKEHHDYFDPIMWLPHSYDSARTWDAFWSYLALALAFWSVRDWLEGKTRRERLQTAEAEARRGADTASAPASTPPHYPEPPKVHAHEFPERLKRLLWVLCINGALVAFEGILQRLDGTPKLLWLVQPRYTDSEGLFGPYAYRANAASYLNLIWPVCLGFWFVLRRSSVRHHLSGGRIGGGSYVVLLPLAVLTAAAPIISTSRGGALVCIVSILAATGLLFWISRREKSWTRAGMLSLFVVILVFAGSLGWRDLAIRLEEIFVDQLSGRTEIYQNSQELARESGVLGTGPATFRSLYQLFQQPKQEWAAYLHDDWLETRITFGWIGFGLILLALILAATRWFVSTGVYAPSELVAFIWLAMAGALVHAKFDFPFQIHSIVFLFLVFCAILACVGRREH